MPRASAALPITRRWASEHASEGGGHASEGRARERGWRARERGWRAWHHHVTMVMLAMLFIAEPRVAHQPGLALLTPHDIVEMLKETLPRKPQGKEALAAQINQRHSRRRSAIESRRRSQRRTDVKEKRCW